MRYYTINYAIIFNIPCYAVFKNSLFPCQWLVSTLAVDGR
jgi:hypothetical protein